MISPLASRRIALRFQGREQSVSYGEARRLIVLLTCETPLVNPETAVAAMRLEDALSRKRRAVVLNPADAQRIVTELDHVEHEGKLSQDLSRLQVTLRIGLARIV